jgi:hypothetical protein
VQAEILRDHVCSLCSPFRGFGLRLQQESVPIQEVFAVLKSSPHGLTSTDGASRLEIFGPNKLEEKKVRSSVLTDRSIWSRSMM